MTTTKGLKVWNWLFIANMQDDERYTGTFIGKNAHNFNVQLADSSIMIGGIAAFEQLGRDCRSGEEITLTYIDIEITLLPQKQ
ncbi:hypothetical protein [Faucicola atlantae]|uniref:hypothetical protein n=1 Tax=Faucicola atlantae TaxID=34059 RepID=UPI0012E7004B|nr:hypothetical protein [Moraxella atlantae]